jgi:hypothetical protein
LAGFQLFAVGLAGAGSFETNRQQHLQFGANHRPLTAHARSWHLPTAAIYLLAALAGYVAGGSWDAGRLTPVPAARCSASMARFWRYSASAR